MRFTQRLMPAEKCASHVLSWRFCEVKCITGCTLGYTLVRRLPLVDLPTPLVNACAMFKWTETNWVLFHVAGNSYLQVTY